MLDYRRKHRLAETGPRRRPVAKKNLLPAARLSRTGDSQYDLQYSLSASGENKDLEARDSANFNNVDLHITDRGLKYPQNTPQLDNRNRYGPKKYQAPIATENWVLIDEWGTFNVLDRPITLRMRGHLHYCKFHRLLLLYPNPITPSMGIQEMLDVIGFLDIRYCSSSNSIANESMKVVNVITASQHSVNSVIQWQQIWPALAQSNPGLLHAIIAITASNQAERNAEIIHSDLQDILQERKLRPNSTDYLFHQAEAVRLINEKLSDPAEACSDATIGAVTLVLCSDVSCTAFHL
jgi:hypothetical protein